MYKHPNSIHKELLIKFWRRFGKNGRKTSVCRGDKRAECLATLRELGSVVIPYRHRTPLIERRELFNKVKFKRHSFNSHSSCFTCESIGEVRHHIIALKNGGMNSKRNLITLCNLCHAEIHPWLRVIHN